MLYATSESQDDDDFGGPLKAFDVRTGKAYKYELPHAGQRIAIDPNGELVTRFNYIMRITSNIFRISIGCAVKSTRKSS